MIATDARGAWQDIERRLRPYVARRVASVADVDDILQEIFVRVHRGLSSLRDGESFGGWVYRVAQSAIADAARARARSVLLLVGETPDIPGQDLEGRDDLENELGACVALFVARLPAPYREAIRVCVPPLRTPWRVRAARSARRRLGVCKSGIVRDRSWAGFRWPAPKRENARCRASAAGARASSAT